VGRNSIHYGKNTTYLSYRIARNYNLKITGWGSIDKLLYDINLLTIKLLAYDCQA
jgi:hypothetical protein